MRNIETRKPLQTRRLQTIGWGVRKSVDDAQLLRLTRPAMSDTITKSNSIGINKWAAGHRIIKIARYGYGDAQEIAWLRDDGARAIETNGDPAFEWESGFDSEWYVITGLRA